MQIITDNSHQVIESVESLRRDVAQLGERMSELEKRVYGSSDKIGPKEDPPPAVEEFSEELLVAISAAIAAYLGVKPHIRQIRLLGGAGWLQQGRITIQASREFAVHHS